LAWQKRIAALHLRPPAGNARATRQQFFLACHSRPPPPPHQGGGLRDSFLVDGVAFKKTFSYAGFEMQPKQYEVGAGCGGRAGGGRWTVHRGGVGTTGCTHHCLEHRLPTHHMPPTAAHPQSPKILLLNIELELKSEKENAEIRLDDPAQYQSIVDAGVLTVETVLTCC
jgi:chaperonin GroEL (HSP60 family)